MDVQDLSWWDHLELMLKAVPPDGWAVILSSLAAITLPLGIEYNVPQAQRPKWLWLVSLAVASLLAVVIALCFASVVRYGLGEGLTAGASCHFLRWALGKVPGFRWLWPLKPSVQFVPDGHGGIKGVHVEGYDGTIVPGIPPAEQTQPKDYAP